MKFSLISTQVEGLRLRSIHFFRNNNILAQQSKRVHVHVVNANVIGTLLYFTGVCSSCHLTGKHERK